MTKSLDPKPWCRHADKDTTAIRFESNKGGHLYFNPRPGYEQDVRHYEDRND